MKLSELKENLSWLSSLKFELSDGTEVPPHFHLTELGSVSKHFIDCGGTVRTEKLSSLQLWYSDDLDHRLTPGKLIDIINMSERILNIEDLEVEVEYQNSQAGNTIGKYGLEFNGLNFVLTTKNTACLASDACGVTPTIDANESTTSCCAPGGKCC